MPDDNRLNRVGKTTIQLVPQESLDKIMCPTLRLGAKNGHLKMDKNGTVAVQELYDYMEFLGFNPDALIVKHIVSKAIQKEDPSRATLIDFKGTLLDHGSVSGAFRNDVKAEGTSFSEEAITGIKAHASDAMSFTLKDAAKATNHFHKFPLADMKTSISGIVSSTFEYALLVDIFGRHGETKEKFLSIADIDAIWKRSEFPRYWEPPKQADIGTFQFLAHTAAQAWRRLDVEIRSLPESLRATDKFSLQTLTLKNIATLSFYALGSCIWICSYSVRWVISAIEFLIKPLIEKIITLIGTLVINDYALAQTKRPAIRSLWSSPRDKATNIIGYYASWPTLTDRIFNARTLAPEGYRSRVESKKLVTLFTRPQQDGREKAPIEADRTSVLFPFFARWLTDSFMRIDKNDRRKNTSNHELDLCQIYGLSEIESNALRSHVDGKLHSRHLVNVDGAWCEAEGVDRKYDETYQTERPDYEEYLPLLFEKADGSKDAITYKGKLQIRKEFEPLVKQHIKVSLSKLNLTETDLEKDFGDSLPPDIEKKLKENFEANLEEYINARFDILSDITGKPIDHPHFLKQIEHMYAAGLERGNASVGYTMFSTLFLREHNRICEKLKEHEEIYDDDKLFHTARLITTIIYLKLIVLDYINHVGGFNFKWGFYPSQIAKLGQLNPFKIKKQWFKSNWISLEFNLLYRWHSMVPDMFQLGDKKAPLYQFFQNNRALEESGLAEAFAAASQQRANKLTLQNSPNYLAGAEFESLEMDKKFKLGSFNSYRNLFGLGERKTLEETFPEDSIESIKKAYGVAADDDFDMDKIDFFVGIFGEEPTKWPFPLSLFSKKRVFGDLMYRMVAHDAFTHLYNNPLLSEETFNEHVLTQTGMDIINTTASFEDLLVRNTPFGRVIAKFSMPDRESK